MKNVMSILNEELVSLMNEKEQLSKFEPSFTENGSIQLYDYEREHPYWVNVLEHNGDMYLDLSGDVPTISFRMWECDKLTPIQLINSIFFLKDEFDKMFDIVYNNPNTDFDLENYLDNELVCDFKI